MVRLSGCIQTQRNRDPRQFFYYFNEDASRLKRTQAVYPFPVLICDFLNSKLTTFSTH